MTITFLAPDGVPVTAQQFRQAQAANYGGGAGRPLGGRSGFRVGTPNNILAATSTTWTLGPCSAMIDPGAATHQGMYGWASDANITGSVTAADSTNGRKDIVYIQVSDSTAGDGSGAVGAPVKYLAGTPSTAPTAPALPARSFLVGTIDVPKVGAGAPVVTLNPSRFVAAGAPLPVSSQSEVDALSLFDGFTVQRLDIPGRPYETWDGSGWFRVGGDTGWLDLPLINGFVPYTAAGWPGAKYRVKNGWCMIDGAIQNPAAWVANTAAAQLPVAARPGVKIQGFNGLIVENTQGYMTVPAGAAGSALSFSITYPVG